MNVYDFDKTIYAGDSTVDFYLHCLRKHPEIITCTWGQARSCLLYATRKIDTTQFKEDFFSFLVKLPNVEVLVETFWDLRQKQIKPWYLRQRRPSDVVISASPAFLLMPICQRLGITSPIATELNPLTGIIWGKNCKGEEKVRRFWERYPGEKIDQFYSDSISDTPLAKLSKKAFLVRGDNFLPWGTL